MDDKTLIAIVISTVIALGLVALVVVLFYYHSRNKELMQNFSGFIKENLKLKEELYKLQDENAELNDELDFVTGGNRQQFYQNGGYGTSNNPLGGPTTPLQNQ